MKAGRLRGAALWGAAGSVAALLLLAEPGKAGKPELEPLFPTSDRCLACHNGLMTSVGDDLSIGIDWRPAMMANAARDPYWQAAVRREVLDHPESQAAIENECSKCHMPMAHVEAHSVGNAGQMFANLPIGQSASRQSQLAADGVSCAFCHQVTATGLGTRKSFVGGFDVDTTRPWGKRQLFGPHEVDRGRARVMSSASRMQPTASDHLGSSEFCATCHTLITHALGPNGEVIGELPEQVPYLEWQHSSYRPSRTCQSCHMPTATEPTAISSVLGQPRENVSRHVFRGGNFFLMKLLGRYGAELGVQASPQELGTAASRTVQHLQSSAARLAVTCSPVQSDRLDAEITVANLAGHKLPTAYPSRRTWLHVVVTDAAGTVLFESGALARDGSIQGNDNDADPTRYEPHYPTIERPDQVQIYEAILGDPAGAVTTGLLTATRYLKDNRILPAGFDKTTAAHEIAVAGGASGDASFRASEDRVRYSLSVAGAKAPLRVDAELWYQPIGYRWAHNLGRQPAMETKRFVSYYRAMSSASAVMLTRATATAR